MARPHAPAKRSEAADASTQKSHSWHELALPAGVEPMTLRQHSIEYRYISTVGGRAVQDRILAYSITYAERIAAEPVPASGGPVEAVRVQGMCFRARGVWSSGTLCRGHGRDAHEGPRPRCLRAGVEADLRVRPGPHGVARRCLQLVYRALGRAAAPGMQPRCAERSRRGFAGWLCAERVRLGPAG